MQMSSGQTIAQKKERGHFGQRRAHQAKNSVICVVG